MARTRQPFTKDGMNPIDLQHDYDLTREDVIVVTGRVRGYFEEMWQDGTLYNGRPHVYRLAQDGDSRVLIDNGVLTRRGGKLGISKPKRDAEWFSIESGVVAPNKRVYVYASDRRLDANGGEYKTGPVRGVWVRQKEG